MENDVEGFFEEQRFESVFNFRCPRCNYSDLLELPVPEFNFNVESMGDLYSEAGIDFTCPECETEFDGYVTCTPASCEITINSPVEFSMTGDPPMFSADPAAAYDPPSDPHELLVETLSRCLIVADMEFDAKNDPQFLKRMAFVTVVTALETYLADTLLNQLKTNEQVLVNLIAGDRLFSDRKIPLTDFVGKPEFASNLVRRAVQEVAFHNLPRADAMYKAALDISLSFEPELWARLNERTAIRHDCVHRNGHDADGERRDDITRDFVEKAAADCRRLADYVEGKVHSLEDLPF